ncbi:MAG: hypothetical protein HC808_08740 [Candidatus Competibacteraceae bacterium]|nr:hypothetical protein [Candidatus Competibacteraceae bacterium]
MEKIRSLILPGLLLSLLTLMMPGVAAADPVIRGVNAGSGGDITITGSGFGKSCKQCEVIADYGGGFKYALPSKSWTDTRVVAQIADLNKSLNVGISIKAHAGNSNTVKHRLKRQIEPAREHRRPLPAKAKSDVLLFDHQSSLAVGDKGERTLDVSGSPPACNQSGQVFDHAQLVYGKRRFGEAQIVAAPPSGCDRCSPLRVRWYHEPTGRLHFQVHVYRRIVEGVCKDRIRR